MPGQSNRPYAVALIVLGVLVVLGIILLVGVLLGDDADEVDPQNGEIVTLLR